MTREGMTPLGDLLRMGIERRGSIRSIAAEAAVSKTALHYALTGSGEGRDRMGEDALSRVARVLELDPIDVLAADGRLPRDVIEYLCAHPELVKKLALHADEERRERDAEAGASAVGQEA
jgi:hypothetical protein